MSANYAVSSQELITVNDELYGSTQLAAASPIILSMVRGENRTDYSDGKLLIQQHSDVNYSLAQLNEDFLLKRITPTDNEISQINAISSKSTYHRYAYMTELTNSTMNEIPTKNIEAQTLNSTMSQWDFAAYFGSFGNYGVFNHPNKITTSAKSASNVSDVTQAIQSALDMYLIPLGLNMSMMNQVTFNATSDVNTLLSKFIPNSKYTEYSALEEFLTYEDDAGKKFKAKIGTFPPFFQKRISEFGSCIELTINTLTQLSHGAMPSIYLRGEDKRIREKYMQFIAESTMFNITEKGAVVRIPLNIT